MKVYVTFCTPDDGRNNAICLGVFSTKKNAEDTLVDYFRDKMIKYYEQGTEIGEYDNEMLNFYKTATPLEILNEMEESDSYCIIATTTDVVIDERIETY